jgi:hypothetical protein
MSFGPRDIQRRWACPEELSGAAIFPLRYYWLDTAMASSHCCLEHSPEKPVFALAIS